VQFRVYVSIFNDNIYYEYTYGVFVFVQAGAGDAVTLCRTQSIF